MLVPSPATSREPSTFGVAGTLISFGGEIKALDDNGKIGGYLVRFGSPDSPDVSRNRDFFTQETDFGLNVTSKTAMIWNHGLDPIIEAKHEGGSCLGVGDLTRDDVGVWVEHQLNLRDDYERKMFDMVKAGKLGYSSGTAAHRVRRERQGNGTHHIKVWPLGADASLTPTPADPYLASAATSLKSLVEVKAIMAEAGTGFAPPNPTTSLRRSAVLGGLSRMRDLTDAAVAAHLLDDQLSPDDRLAACSDCFSRHGSSATQLIGAMMRTGDGDDDVEVESLKSVWIEHVKSAFSHLTLTDQVDAVHTAVDGLVSRLSAYAALKSADGRLVPVRRVTEFEAFRDTLSALVQAARPKPDDDALITQGLAALSRAGLALHGVD
jgi:hypothetical protein